MEFRILGPLEVASDDDVLEVHGAKTRALLALFLVHANQVVAQDRLIDDLWEGAPPNSATPTLQTYVSQLRKSLPLARRLLAQARPYWLHLACILVLDFAAVPLALLAPVPLKIAIDSACS